MQIPAQVTSLAASIVVVTIAWLSHKAVSLRDLVTAHNDLMERVEVYKSEYEKCIEGNKSACHRAEVQLDELQRVTKELRQLLTREMRKK